MKLVRREFLKHTVRGGLITGWLLVCCELLQREGTSCPATCAGCKRYQGCRKPQRQEAGRAT